MMIESNSFSIDRHLLPDSSVDSRSLKRFVPFRSVSSHFCCSGKMSVFIHLRPCPFPFTESHIQPESHTSCHQYSSHVNLIFCLSSFTVCFSSKTPRCTCPIPDPEAPAQFAYGPPTQVRTVPQPAVQICLCVSCHSSQHIPRDT
ncbi:hypothetical protein HETIRDRAFT_323641 [Heterobasidion irregulare TC 32-1]|uniref:Uncharacterized protein n=1 Tax=Heterobasidion irregulare (strain TC 32-1) TaxID=747525 RepID=W4K052_HETIT|nr:uncharacterized protein HETIRDRAFT_323641 [Heterobasidion irregulare TC 32-1]ETW79172.1 hypothetical protein HETIRDRAFT_323641 [Heterobasidion irregulare TC 32-1]